MSSIHFSAKYYVRDKTALNYASITGLPITGEVKSSPMDIIHFLTDSRNTISSLWHFTLVRCLYVFI